MNIVWTEELIYILRLVIAGICGFIIGFERKNRAKEAGVRTHFVVACGAALMMIISKYGFFDIDAIDGLKGADGSRIASQVVNGIGFLGAGMIFVHRGSISGLTTAAGVWATAGIGMAIGAGMYIIGIGATLIIVFAQYVLHKHIATVPVPKSRAISIYDIASPDFRDTTIKKLSDMGITTNDVFIIKHSESQKIDYKFIVDIPARLNEEKIVQLFHTDCEIKDATE